MPEKEEYSNAIIQQELQKPAHMQNSMTINVSPDAVGPGQGFSGTELLSKDELNLILDLEDEASRMGDFQRIYPNPGTCHQYYSLMEVSRYANALYCAYMSTTPINRAKLIQNCLS